MAVRTPRRAEIEKTGGLVFRYKVHTYTNSLPQATGVDKTRKTTRHITRRGARRRAREWTAPTPERQVVETYSEW